VKKILVLAEYYEPFIKGGGPIQSIKNIVNSLYNKFSFKIISSDRDLGDAMVSPKVSADKWQDVGNAEVYYTKINVAKIIRLLKKTDYDILYLNSFFASKLSILPVLMRKLNVIKDKKIILAPRGEFSLGALGLKNAKKKLFISMARFLGLYKDITWHATSESEKQTILKQFKFARQIKIACNLTADYSNLTFRKTIPKLKGEINLIYVSRIHAIKNLKFALSILKSVKGNIHFKIFGPIENKTYWEECQSIIIKLEPNCLVTYEGILAHDDIIEKLQESHLFLLPTLGENYGHVISEALAAGCPVIISDQTPWRNLAEKGVGFDISLNSEDEFVKALQYYIDLDEDEYLCIAQKAYNFGLEMSNKHKDLEENYKLFEG